MPITVFKGNTNTGLENSTDTCGRTTFFLSDGSYRFGAFYDGKEYFSSETDQCQVLGCVRSNIVIPPQVSPSSADINSLCTGALCQSHILFEGVNQETTVQQVRVFTISDGTLKVVIDNLAPDAVDVAFLKDGNQFMIAGAGLWLSDLKGSPIKKVEDPKSLLLNFQPFSPIWDLIASQSGDIDAENDQQGQWHSPNNNNIAKWKPGDTELLLQNKRNGIVSSVYQTGTSDTIKGSWSPDGNSFAFSYSNYGEAWYSQVFIVNSDGTGLRPLSSPIKYASLSSPYWSPDGESIVYMKTGPCSDYHYLIATAVATGDTKSFGINNIPASYLSPEEIIWSPDSKWVAFLSETPLENAIQRDIEILNPETGENRRLTQEASFIPLMIDWR